MKAKLVSQKEFNEDFYDEESRDSHYKSHVNGLPGEWPEGYFKTPREYEIAANMFALTKVRSSDINSQDNIVGFIQDDGTYLKYDKTKKEMLLYKPDKRVKPGVKIITYFKSDDRKYNRRFKERYKSEITKDF